MPVSTSTSIQSRPATSEAATSTQPGQRSLPVGRYSVISAKALNDQRQLLPLPRPEKALDEMPVRHRAAPPGTGASRKISDVKQVVVMDWDDCLVDDKGLTYQVMHNALEIAAREHAQTLPELREAVSRLSNRMQSEQAAGDSDPLLMKDQEDFRKHLRAHPGIYGRHVAEDFVSKMLPGLDKPRAKSVTHAANAQFNRQYKAVTSLPQNGKPRDLPFPDVELSLLPGALELLERCRTDESCVPLLISNRNVADLGGQVDRLGMAPYFNVVSGVPRMSQPKPGAEPVQMPEELQKRLTCSLGSSPADCDDAALRRVLEEAAVHAHPDTTVVNRVDMKPSAERLRQILADLSVPDLSVPDLSVPDPSVPDPSVLLHVPITSYGDQTSDIQQMAPWVEEGRPLKGVIINPQRADLGQMIDVAGIQTMVVRSLEDTKDIKDFLDKSDRG